MVKVNEAEWDKQRKRSKIDDNGLTQYDRDLIGKAVRIEIPFMHPTVLKGVPDLLRGLATQIEFTLQRDDLPLRARLHMLKTVAADVNARIRVARETAEGSL